MANLYHDKFEKKEADHTEKWAKDNAVVNQQAILERAIQRAIEGGWKQPNELTFISNKEYIVYLDSLSSLKDREWLKFKMHELIFNHDFAKALWGSKPYHYYATGEGVESFDGEKTEYDFQIEDVLHLKNWAYHLQQMVVAEDPIVYLGEHL